MLKVTYGQYVEKLAEIAPGEPPIPEREFPNLLASASRMKLNEDGTVTVRIPPNLRPQ